MLCAKIILTDFKITTVLTDFDKEWERVKLARNTTFLEQNPQFHDAETLGAISAAKEILKSKY
jgi:hypothetical protein